MPKKKLDLVPSDEQKEVVPTQPQDVEEPTVKEPKKKAHFERFLVGAKGKFQAFQVDEDAFEVLNERAQVVAKPSSRAEAEKLLSDLSRR